MTTETPISAAWETYRDGVLPKNSPQVQIDECRKAFYAGAFSHHCIATSIGEPGISEDRGVEILTAVDAEIREYVQSIQPRNPERN